MNKVSRLAAISPTLFESLEHVSHARRRQVAVAMCAMAVKCTNLGDKTVEHVMELLLSGGAIDPKKKQDLDELRNHFDEKYFNLGEASQKHTPEALQIFRKARAVSALIHTTSFNADEIFDAIYEAIHSPDDQTEAIRAAENYVRGFFVAEIGGRAN